MAFCSTPHPNQSEGAMLEAEKKAAQELLESEKDSEILVGRYIQLKKFYSSYFFYFVTEINKMKNNDIGDLLKKDEYYHKNAVNEIISNEIKVFFNSLFDQRDIKALSLDEAKQYSLSDDFSRIFYGLLFTQKANSDSTYFFLGKTFHFFPEYIFQIVDSSLVDLKEGQGKKHDNIIFVKPVSTEEKMVKEPVKNNDPGVFGLNFIQSDRGKKEEIRQRVFPYNLFFIPIELGFFGSFLVKKYIKPSNVGAFFDRYAGVDFRKKVWVRYLERSVLLYSGTLFLAVATGHFLYNQKEKIKKELDKLV